MIRAIATAALIATAVPAHADRISILTGSSHVGAPGQFEEFNPGIFYTWDDRKIDISAGIYRNSYGGTSVAVTGALPLIEWDRGELAAFAGLALYPGDGQHFKHSLGDVVPLAGLQVRHDPFFMQVIPMDGDPVDVLLSFGLTWHVGR